MRGLLEVEPLHFTCHATSDGTKVEKVDAGNYIEIKPMHYLITSWEYWNEFVALLGCHSAPGNFMNWGMPDKSSASVSTTKLDLFFVEGVS